MRKATVAGLAAGLVATGQVEDEVRRRVKILRVGVNGEAERDCALVDVAVSADRFVGARALWRPEEEIFVVSASPDAVGFSSVAGLLDPTPRSAPYGLHLRLADLSEAETALTVPLTPGLVVPVGVVKKRWVQSQERRLR